MRIRFLSDQTYETEGPGKGPQFAAGQELAAEDVARSLGMSSCTPEYAEAFLRRWVSRRAAELVTDENQTGADEATEPGEKPLDEMTRAELDALAAVRKIDITSARNKADVIALIEAATPSIDAAHQQNA